MTALNVYVAGMGCQDCVRKLTARLRDVPGVETVSADRRRSVVVLVGSMSRADVLAALDGTRFHVERFSPAASSAPGPGSRPESGETGSRQPSA